MAGFFTFDAIIMKYLFRLLFRLFSHSKAPLKFIDDIRWEQLDGADSVLTEKEAKLSTFEWLVRKAEREACVVLKVEERRP